MHWDGWVTSRNMPRATLVSSAAKVLTPTCFLDAGEQAGIKM